jgi:hypothetical protein
VLRHLLFSQQLSSLELFSQQLSLRALARRLPHRPLFSPQLFLLQLF